jgi:hypothetical protein
MYALKRISCNDEGRESMRMITKIQTTWKIHHGNLVKILGFQEIPPWMEQLLPLIPFPRHLWLCSLYRCWHYFLLRVVICWFLMNPWNHLDMFFFSFRCVCSPIEVYMVKALHTWHLKQFNRVNSIWTSANGWTN